jgi:FkbM family methyltransferase
VAEIVSCGHKLTIPDMYAGDFAHEIEVRDRWWHITAGETVLDIGSSLGTYTLPALAAGACVFSVDVLEQNPLREMIKANGLADRSVLIQAAVGGEHGYPPELMSAVGTNPVIYPGLADSPIWTTVDNLVKGYCIERVDWIKVDTEGAEVPILRGAWDTLERDHPRLLIEEHSHLPHIRAMDNARRLRELLVGHGYTVEIMPYDNRELWFCHG